MPPSAPGILELQITTTQQIIGTLLISGGGLMQISRICSILNIQGVHLGRADLQQPAGRRNKAAREHEKMGLKISLL